MTRPSMQPPAPETAPEKSPMERMADLTQRLIRVPKSEMPDTTKAKKQAKGKRH